jgi:hypothetical protein
LLATAGTDSLPQFAGCLVGERQGHERSKRAPALTLDLGQESLGQDGCLAAARPRAQRHAGITNLDRTLLFLRQED